MENKRLHIEATEEAITVYWEKWQENRDCGIGFI